MNVSARVQAALARRDICHREPEFGDLQDAIRARILEVFDADKALYVTVLMTGSGTAAVEAMISSAVPDEGRLLVLENGTYGERIVRIARAHRIRCDVLPARWTERPSIDLLRDKLRRTQYDSLAVVHHETTTGLLNDLRSVSLLCREFGVRMLVDAVSSLGGESLDFSALNVAAVSGTANKCIQGIPGVSFVIVDRSFMRAMVTYPERTIYLHLPRHYAEQARRSTAFTPAIHALYAFLEALDELADESVNGRMARYGRASTIVRNGLEQLGFELVLPPSLRAIPLTAIKLPVALPYPDLHDALKKEGFVIYAGLGPSAARQFRVATMGDVPEHEYHRFLQAVEQTVKPMQSRR